MKLSLLTACAVLVSAPAAFSAVFITESFNGSGALVTPGNTGDHTGSVYTVTITETVGCAEISFDVSVSVGTGPVHFDTRGFGDSGSTNDAFQTTPAVETMSFSIGAVTATALAGSTLSSNSVTVEFTSFDLVNNGASPPAVDWTTNLATSGTTTAPAGSGSGAITTEAGVIGSTTIDIVASNAWMWLDNAQFSYSGDVIVEKIPEPSATLLGVLGGLVLLRRRRG